MVGHKHFMEVAVGSIPFSNKNRILQYVQYKTGRRAGFKTSVPSFCRTASSQSRSSTKLDQLMQQQGIMFTMASKTGIPKMIRMLRVENSKNR